MVSNGAGDRQALGPRAVKGLLSEPGTVTSPPHWATPGVTVLEN